MSKNAYMIRKIIALLAFYSASTSAVIQMQGVMQIGNSISGNAQDNGVPYTSHYQCFPETLYKCEYGVILQYMVGATGYSMWASGYVSPYTTTEEGRLAWLRSYGSNVPFRVTVPAGASDPHVCWGSKIVGGGFIWGSCSSTPVRPPPPPPTCSGSAGTIDFGSLQQDKYSGVGRNTSINIYCSGAATIRFRSGNNVSLNNGTSAILKFNGVSQGSNFYMRAGNNSVTVDATLSGTPSLGDFTGSSTVILDVL